MKQQTIKNVSYKRRCKYCDSDNVRRYGRSRDTQMQRLQCCDCKRTFMDTDSLPGMKMSQELISLVFDMYYSNIKLDTIQRRLMQMYNDYPSDSTIYEWVDKFTQQAIERTKEYKPEVGDVWIADETELRIGRRRIWCLDIVDTKTRYLLSSCLSTSRTQHNTELLIYGATKKAGKSPNVVITDQPTNYFKCKSWNFNKGTKYISAEILTSERGKQLIKRFHSAFKTRTRIMRGLKTLKTADNLLQGWIVFYNYLRPHEALRGKTPAQKAGIDQLPKNWTIHKANLSGW